MKELSKILAKEMIARANKKAAQIMINQEVEANAKKESGSSRNRSNLNDVMGDIDLSWVAKSDRFKHFTRQK